MGLPVITAVLSQVLSINARAKQFGYSCQAVAVALEVKVACFIL